MQASTAYQFLQDHAYADIALPLITSLDGPTTIQDAGDEDLFASLKVARDELAKQYQVKPYTLLPDHILAEMATTYPTNIKELVQVTQLSSAQAHKYGPPLLEITRQHLSKNNLETTSPKPTLSPKKYETQLAIVRYIDAGFTLDELEEQLEEPLETIIGYLESIQTMGIKLNLVKCTNQFLDTNDQELILQYFQARPQAPLEQAQDDLEDYTELELRLMRLVYNYQQV